MSEGIITKLKLHKETLIDGATLDEAFTVSRACTIRGTIKASAAVRLQLDVLDAAAATTDTGYLLDADPLVVDAWTPFSFEAIPLQTYTLKIADAGAVVSLYATEVHGSVL